MWECSEIEGSMIKVWRSNHQNLMCRGGGNHEYSCLQVVGWKLTIRLLDTVSSSA